ncbi:MAG: type II toxin-antitoxin system VapC family toxin [Actinomycetota bacterium]
MRTVYIDSGAFIALIRRRDRHHERFRSHFSRLRADRDRLITSDAVISETVTRLRYDIGLHAVLSFQRVIAGSAGHLRIRDSDPRLRAAAFEVLAQYAELRLSYADCVGAVVAREARAKTIFGLDEEFRVMGFSLEP